MSTIQFNGFFFNKIPLFKKLKLREVMSGKVLYGGVRNENNPDLQFIYTLNFLLIKQSDLPTTYTLNKTPYVEVSAGIMNIFKIDKGRFCKKTDLLKSSRCNRMGYQNKGKNGFLIIYGKSTSERQASKRNLYNY